MYLTCITITQSTIITSPIGFNKGLTNGDARLKQHCINVVPSLRNVVSTLFQRRALTWYQRCATLKIWRRILFHFQRRINVISTLIHNVETTLIRRWNVGWGISLPVFPPRTNLKLHNISVTPRSVKKAIINIYFSKLSGLYCFPEEILNHCKP